MKKTKYGPRILSILLALTIAIGLIQITAQATPPINTARVIIGNNSDPTAVWTGDLIDCYVLLDVGDTMLDVIAKALTLAVNGAADYPSEGVDIGFISSINGLENDVNYVYGWMGAINGVFAPVGFDSVFVKDGDTVNLQYLDYYADNSNVGDWGSSNITDTGFEFSSGRVVSETVDWGGGYIDTILTLILPQGTPDIRVIDVPYISSGSSVRIYLNDDSTEYALNQSIPIGIGDKLMIVVDSYEYVYDISVSFIGKDDIAGILGNMAPGLSGSINDWEIISLSAYEKYIGNSTLTPAVRTAYTNAAISDINTGVDFSTYAKIIVTLQSLGIDPSRLYAVNSMQPIDAFEKLRSAVDAADFDSLVATTQIVLEAIRLQPTNNSTQEQAIINFLLDARNSNGGWGYYIGADSDADVTAMVLSGLAPYYLMGQTEVVAAVNDALNWLAVDQQKDDGTFGYTFSGVITYNSSSTAYVVAALCALGIDPHQNSFLKYSALDGLLSYILPDQSGFDGYGDWEAQGFRGLVAAAQFYKNNAPFNIYDFSSNATAPGVATGVGTSPPTTPPTPSSPNNIQVWFTLKGLDDEIWIARHSVTIQSDARIYHLLMGELDSAGYTYVVAQAGYVRSITRPSGDTLTEFQYGADSGWVYSIDGVLPTVGLLDQGLKVGDDVVWYYTSDYTKEPGASNFTGGGSGGGQTASGGSAQTEVEAAVEDMAAVAEVSHEMVKDLIAKAIEKGASDVAIILTSTEDVSSIEASLTAGSINEIVSNSMSLTVSSDIAVITFDRDALKGLTVGAADSADVRIVAAIIDAETDLNVRQQLVVGDNPVIDLSVFIGEKKITNFSGTVIVSVPYTPPTDMLAEDYDLLTVYYLDANGNISEMEGAKYDPATGMITFTTSHFSIFFVSEWISPFGDIARGDWCYRAVRFTFSNSLMTGTATNVFSPNIALSRAMLVTILAREDGVDTSGGATWFSQAMDWGIAADITDGTSPEADITREQFATMMYRYAQYKGLSTPDGSYTEDYADADTVSTWASDAMQWANANGLITGRTTTTLVPRGTATRAEASTILMRFIEGFSEMQ